MLFLPPFCLSPSPSAILAFSLRFSVFLSLLHASIAFLPCYFLTFPRFTSILSFSFFRLVTLSLTYSLSLSLLVPEIVMSTLFMTSLASSRLLTLMSHLHPCPLIPLSLLYILYFMITALVVCDLVFLLLSSSCYTRSPSSSLRRKLFFVLTLFASFHTLHAFLCSDFFHRSLWAVFLLLT